MLIRPILSLTVIAGHAMAFSHLEPRQQDPLALTPDGRLLLALHSTAHTLSVFDPGTPARLTPLLIAEIPLSTAPVTVKARTDSEAWIVNEGADSVSVVSLTAKAVIDTLRVPDEPADVVFAAGKAFVSCSQGRAVAVFDAGTRQSLGTIAIDGVAPRALAASADGSTIFVACLLSGNGTTILPKETAPPQPAPLNPALPPAPKAALIVTANDPRVTWNVLDHDIAEIDTTTLTLTRWLTGIGTHLFDLSFHPDGSLWCAHSDALNLTRFEPELNGDFVRHRLTRINLPGGTSTSHDLNPGIHRQTSPHAPSIASALAGPAAITFNSDGSRIWIAAFQSDRIAEIEAATGAVLRRIDLRPTGGGPEAMRGPRGLVLRGSRLHVLNKISDTLATIDTTSGDVLSEIPLGSIDPMPLPIRQGRGVLYDARLSGNGTISCASCHIDADRDGLAWDLGNPAGDMIDIPSADLSLHSDFVYDRAIHPMKGPLTTQTLRGLGTNDAVPVGGLEAAAAAIVTKFHWRGDKPSIQSFNATFRDLMGGTLVPGPTMDRLDAYLKSIVHPPNPNLNLDRSLRSDHPEGNAVEGNLLFQDHAVTHCMVCHGLSGGTDQNLDLPGLIGATQPVKNPALRTVYQRAGVFNPLAGADSLSGFGLGSDGSGHALPASHPYLLSTIHRPPLTDAKAAALRNLTAFILSFDTGTPPAACHDLTLNQTNHADPSMLEVLAVLESRAAAGDCGLVAHALVDGGRKAYLWEPDGEKYRPSDASSPLSRSELLNLLGPDDSLTFQGVLPGEATWRSIDRNANSVPDSIEPVPALSIMTEPGGIRLEWSAADWFPEGSHDLASPWVPAPGEVSIDGTAREMALPPGTLWNFFRLRRTW